MNYKLSYTIFEFTSKCYIRKMTDVDLNVTEEDLTCLVVVVHFHHSCFQVPDRHILLQCHAVSHRLTFLQLQTQTYVTEGACASVAGSLIGRVMA